MDRSAWWGSLVQHAGHAEADASAGGASVRSDVVFGCCDLGSPAAVLGRMDMQAVVADWAAVTATVGACAPPGTPAGDARVATLLVSDALGGAPCVVPAPSGPALAAHAARGSLPWRLVQVSAGVAALALSFVPDASPVSPIARSVILAALVLDLALLVTAAGWRQSFRSGWNRVLLGVLALFLVESAAALAVPGAIGRSLRVLRPALLAVYVPRVRRDAMLIVRTGVTTGLHGGVLLVAFVVFAGSVGTRALYGVYDTTTTTTTTAAAGTGAAAVDTRCVSHFDDMGSAAVSLVLMLTRKSSSAVVVTAVDSSAWAMGYFVVVVVVGVWILMAVVLAAAFGAYRSEAGRSVGREYTRMRRACMAAYFVLVRRSRAALTEGLDTRVLSAFVQTYSKGAGAGDLGDYLGATLLAVLSVPRVSLLEFFQVCDALGSLRVWRRTKPRVCSAWALWGRAAWMDRLARAVQHWVFEGCVAMAVVAITVVVAGAPASSTSAATSRLVTQVYGGFLAGFVAELGLRAAASGPEFFAKPWNTFDMGIVAVCGISEAVLVHGAPGVLVGESQGDVLRPLIMLRLLPRFAFAQAFVVALYASAKTMASMVLVMVLVLHAFATVAVEVLGERSGWRDGICPDVPPGIAFDTFPRAMSSLFVVVTTASWAPIVGRARWVAGDAFALSFFGILLLVVSVVAVSLLSALFVENFVSSSGGGAAPVQPRRHVLGDFVVEISPSPWDGIIHTAPPRADTSVVEGTSAHSVMLGEAEHMFGEAEHMTSLVLSSTSALAAVSSSSGLSALSAASSSSGLSAASSLAATSAASSLAATSAATSALELDHLRV